MGGGTVTALITDKQFLCLMSLAQLRAIPEENCTLPWVDSSSMYYPPPPRKTGCPDSPSAASSYTRSQPAGDTWLALSTQICSTMGVSIMKPDRCHLTSS